MNARAERGENRSALSADDDLGHAAGDEHQHQVGADRRRGGPSQQGVDDPADLLGPARSRSASSWPGPAPRRRSAPPRAPRRRRPAAAPRTQSGGWLARNTAERARMSTSPGTMKHSPPRTAADSPPQAPGAVDGQLGRCRAGEEVRRGDGVLELLRLDPLPFLDAQATEQGDVGGRSPEPDAPETEPLLADGAEGHRHRQASGRPHPRRRSRVLVAEHLVGQLPELALGRLQRPSPLGGRHIGTASPPVDDLLARSDQPFGSPSCAGWDRGTRD